MKGKSPTQDVSWINQSLRYVTSKEADRSVGVQKMRSFAEIIFDAKEKRNIIEIKMTKMFVKVDEVTTKSEKV